MGGQEGRRGGLGKGEGKKGLETNGLREQRPQAWKRVAVPAEVQPPLPSTGGGTPGTAASHSREPQPRALEPARGRSRSRPPEGAAGAGAAKPEEGGGEPAEKGQPRRQGRQRRSSAPRASPVPAPQ